jgi:hypothetical protein
MHVIDCVFLWGYISSDVSFDYSFGCAESTRLESSRSPQVLGVRLSYTVIDLDKSTVVLVAVSLNRPIGPKQIECTMSPRYTNSNMLSYHVWGERQTGQHLFLFRECMSLAFSQTNM